MGRKHWKEEDIIAVLREAEKGDVSVGDLCRKHEIAEVTFYKWRKRYGGVEKTEVRRLKELKKKTPISRKPWVST